MPQQVNAIVLSPFWNFLVQLALGQIRHIATAGFAILATKGFISGDDVDTATGAIMVLATLAFSAYDKWKHHAATGTAIIVHPAQVAPSLPQSPTDAVATYPAPSSQ